MSPNLRRAAHQALDLILDALAEEQRGEPVKRKRGPAIPPPPKPRRDLTPEELEELDRRLGKAGLRRAG